MLDSAKPDWLSMQYDSFAGFFSKTKPHPEFSFLKIFEKYQKKYASQVDNFRHWDLFPLDKEFDWEEGIFRREIWNEIKGYSAVIILPYALEDVTVNFLIETIAHELAHILLRHLSIEFNRDWHLIHEIQANELVDRWGLLFDKELKSNMLKTKRKLAKSLKVPMKYLKIGLCSNVT